MTPSLIFLFLIFLISPPPSESDNPAYPPPLTKANLHEADGSHYVHINVGTPPQRQSVIVDTGSFQTAFPCSDCKSCGAKFDAPFDDHASTTGQEVMCPACHGRGMCEDDHCVFSQSYAEGSSWKAIQFMDVVRLGALPLDNFVFGCQVEEQGLFEKQKIDGIMGLVDYEGSIVRAMTRATRMFSLCLTPTGGTFSIGGMPASTTMEAPMVFASVESAGGDAASYYSLKVEDIRIGDMSLKETSPRLLAVLNRGKRVIVDSGTTDTYLPVGVDKALGFDIKSQERDFTKEEFDNLPALVFVFDGGSEFRVPPSNYMEPGASLGRFTSRLYFDEHEGAVLGANALLFNEVFFDATEGGRIGFAPSSCM